MSSSASSTPGARRAMVIEFVGTPGAGKSTLTEEAVRLLRGRGFAAGTVVAGARRRAGRTLPGRTLIPLAPPPLRPLLLWHLFYALGIAHGLRFGVERPSLVRRVIGTQLGRPIPAAAKRHILFWFLQLCGRHRFSTTSSLEGEVIVFDDGFLHRAVHLHASHLEILDAECVRAYVDLLPEPDLVVFVSADRHLCERRIRRRGVWPHSRRLSDAELAGYIAASERVVDVAVRRARERGWNVVEVGNGRDGLEHAVRDLQEALDRYLAAMERRSAAKEPA